MRDFQFYVTDTRYQVPSLLLVTLYDECSAWRIAKGLMADPQHLEVEVWDRDARLFSLPAADPGKA